jgi:hypothetical protein
MSTSWCCSKYGVLCVNYKKLTLSVAIVSGTSSPRTSFRKILLKDRSIMRESSIALATNCPMTRKICVLFLHKPMLNTSFLKNLVSHVLPAVVDDIFWVNRRWVEAIRVIDIDARTRYIRISPKLQIFPRKFLRDQ